MRCRGLATWVVVLAAVSAGPAPPGRAADDADVVGTWKLKFEPGDGTTHEADLAVTKEATGLKAAYTEGSRKETAKDVSYKDGVLRFTIEARYEGAAASTTFAGKVKGAAVDGECKWSYLGMTGSFKFTGSSPPAKPGK